MSVHPYGGVYLTILQGLHVLQQVFTLTFLRITVQRTFPSLILFLGNRSI